MSEQTPQKKSYVTNAKLKVYSVTAGEQRAKSSLGFGTYKGDFNITCQISKDSDQKGDRPLYIAVGFDIFTAQMVIDAIRNAAMTEGAFEPFTVVTNGKSNWDPATKRKTPGEIKNELTVFKKPNGVICIAFKDIAKDAKTAIELIHPNREIFHNILVNKEPVTDAVRSKLLALAMTQQLTLAIALSSNETYEPPAPYDPNKKPGGYGGGQSSYKAPAQKPAAELEETDIPY
jgi:hypothetical protein